MMLINRINHPSREMHQLFADSLFEVIFGTTTTVDDGDNNTMFRK